MKKRTLKAVVCVVLAIALLIGGFLAWHYWISPLRVGEFALEDYAYFLEEFSFDKNVGAITDAREAREKGLAVLAEIYGEDVRDQKPFKVSFDEAADAWLIAGSLPPVPMMVGGTAHIIIASGGDVLAVWHEK